LVGKPKSRSIFKKSILERGAAWRRLSHYGFIMNELPIVQKTYDLIKWYVPILNRLPRSHKFSLGDRIIAELYDLLKSLIVARYAKEKLAILEPLNGTVDLLRHQTRLMLDFNLMEPDRYEYASKLIVEIGTQLGGWIDQQKRKSKS
jgi:hypothetical protein